jgi:nitroreductase
MENWNRIIANARYAPSPHNTQPWRVRIIDQRRALLYLDVKRTLPDEDRTGAFMNLAMGLFLAALEIAAGNAGFGFRFQLIEGREEHLLREFARLELTDSPAGSRDYPDELLRRRMTSRRPSDGRRLDPAVTDFLKQFAPPYGYQYHQIDDRAQIEAIVQENIRAVFHDLNDRLYHDEIARWFRYSDREAREKRDGLDHRCMLASPMELRMMRRFPAVMQWRLTRGLMWRRYRRQLGAFTHIGVLGGKFFEQGAAVGAGQFLLRFWLELARRDLYVHPMGNLVTNPESQAWFRSATGISDAWLIFRIGHTQPPPRSYRLNLEEVLVHD